MQIGVMEQANALKEKGNELYKLKQFEEALTFYIKASGLQPQDPVFHSNISAALFEIGNYPACLKSIDTALSLLSPPSINYPLVSRLLLRNAKALLYSNKVDECAGILSRLSSVCQEGGINVPSELGTMEDVIKRAKSGGPLPKLSVFRSCTDTRVREYYVVGHDKIQSVFSGNLTTSHLQTIENATSRDQKNSFLLKFHKEAPLRIKLTENDEKINYSFLLGGVGDARHLFGSLLDMEKIDFLNTPKKFHFTMVDIKTPAIARDLLMIYIIRHLSTFSDAQLTNDINAIEYLSLAFFTYLSLIIPEYLFVHLIKFIQSLISDLENNSLPAWIILDKKFIPEMLEYLKDWLNVKVETEKIMTLNTQPMIPDQDDDLMFFQDFSINLPVSDLMAIPNLPGATLAEKRKNIKKKLDKKWRFRAQMRESSTLVPGVFIENLMHKKVEVILPPEALMDRHPELKALFEEYRRKKTTPTPKEKINKLAEDAISHIEETFKPNPTFWDKKYMKMVEESYDFGLNAFDSVSGICDIPNPQPFKTPNRIYDYMALFFSRLAKVFGKVNEKGVKLEWIVGDVFEVCRDISDFREEREKMGLPVDYDRIYLSNIPDYTGGNLPIFIFCAPILKPLPHTYITYNVLLNTSAFKDFEECAQTYSLLPNIAAHEKYLAMKHIHGDLWGRNHIKWSVLKSPLPLSHLASQEDLTHWLHRIFLYIVLPPVKNPLVLHRIDYPLNLCAFVTLLKRLAAIGYPRHWLAAVLDSLLEGTLKTKARPPPNSMNLHYGVANISTMPFIADLEIAIASNLHHLPFLPTIPLPSSFVETTYHPIIPPRETVHTYVLTLVFASKGDLTNKNITPAYQKLRESILNGHPSVIVLSSFSWDYKTSTLKFWMEKEKLEKMAREDWYVKVVRADNCINATFTATAVKDIISL